MANAPLILASGSAIRRNILKNAGLEFTVQSPGVDEDPIKAAGAARGASLETIAMELAEAKALAVAAPADTYVLGSDQIMECEGARFGKPASMDEAASRLTMLAGKTHHLINAVAIARAGRVVYRHIDKPALTMHALTTDEISAYLNRAGPDILSSVGAYQVETIGMRLFLRIDGDFYATLGLSIFPVLTFLRNEKAIDF